MTLSAAGQAHSWQDWAFNSMSGAAGSFLALIGALLVFLFTRRHDRQRDELARTGARKQDWERRLDELLADVALSGHPFRADPSEGTHPEDCSRMSASLMILGLHMAREEPDVSEWCLEMANTFFDLGRSDSGEPNFEAGRAIGVLTEWRAGRVPSKRFRRLAEEQAEVNAGQDPSDSETSGGAESS